MAELKHEFKGDEHNAWLCPYCGIGMTATNMHRCGRLCQCNKCGRYFSKRIILEEVDMHNRGR